MSIITLLSNAHTPPPEGKVYYFEGDLNQMMKAAEIAAETFGIEVDFAGGQPYVKTKEDFDKVVQYMILNKIEGYWNYKKD